MTENTEAEGTVEPKVVKLSRKVTAAVQGERGGTVALSAYGLNHEDDSAGKLDPTEIWPSLAKLYVQMFEEPGTETQWAKSWEDQWDD